MESPGEVVLDVGNDGGDAVWRHRVTFLDSRGMVCRWLLHFGRGGGRQPPSWHSDGGGSHKIHPAQSKSSLWR